MSQKVTRECLLNCASQKTKNMPPENVYDREGSIADKRVNCQNRTKFDITTASSEGNFNSGH